MKDLTFAVVGQDLRQCYLAEYLINKGYQVICFGLPSFTWSCEINIASSLKTAVQTADVIVGPVPFSQKTVPYREELLSCLQKGDVLAAGALDQQIREQCGQKGIVCYDYMEFESLTWANAALTAEGILAEVMTKTPFALSGTKALVIGFGRCGQMTAIRLAALGCRVGVCEAEEVRLAQASACGYDAFSPEKLQEHFLKYSVIINTVPKLVVTDRVLNSVPCSLHSAPILFDLASAPGGIDLEACKKRGLEAYSCPGLPGKIAPKTAGEVVGKTVLHCIFL